MISIICNNNDNIFGTKLSSNFNTNTLKYLDNSYKVNYIKFYGSISKYFGSHINDIPPILKYIKQTQKLQLLDKLHSNQKTQFIYFNNLEGDLNNIKFSQNTNNLQIPSAVYDARILYLLLNILNKF